MPRAARHTPGGYVYHVLNRGVGGMELFSKSQDYYTFESILAETVELTKLRLGRSDGGATGT